MHVAHRAFFDSIAASAFLGRAAPRLVTRIQAVFNSTFRAVIAASVLAITMGSAHAFTVTPSTDAGGAISPNTPQSVSSGTVAFTLSPGPGFVVVVGGTCGGTLSGPTYTTNAITADCTVVATHYSVARPALGAGQDHTCTVASTGGGVCWGSNQYGQIGDSTTITRSRPVNVTGLPFNTSAFDGGWGHTCAVTTGGAAKCWGWNSFGQIGDGSNTQRNMPVDVTGLGSGVTGIAAGYGHTCALTNSGRIKCWGDGNFGHLGNGATSTSLVPVDVSTLGPGSGVRAIGAGKGHTCAVTSGGGLKCWGENAWDQLGNNDPMSSPQSVPVDVFGLTSGIATVSGGDIHTCALTSYGGVQCWGSNDSGQLGDGSNSFYSNVPVNVNGLSSGVIAVASGSFHSCALKSTGAIKCWGSNNLGQIGDGTATSRNVPVDTFVTNAVAIAAGALHTCAVLDSGTTACWGNNANGSVGNGTIGGSNYIPVTTTPPSSTTTVVASASNPSVFGDSVTFTATIGGGINGVGVNFLADGVTIPGCAAVALAAGTATCTTNSLQGGVRSITTIYVGDANTLASSSAVLAQTVNPTVQTIAFDPLPTKTDTDPPFTVAATTSSGLTVTFTSQTPSICTVSGNTVTLVASGANTCTIAANQLGNSNYNAAPQVVQSFSILGTGPALALVSVKSRKTHGATGDFDIPINPTIPISGLIDVDPRQIGAGHRIIFTFNVAVSNPGTVVLTDKDGLPIGSNTLATSSNDVIVTLTGIPDIKRVNIALSNVNGGTNTFQAAMGFFVGDVSNNRFVNTSDILLLKGKSGPVTAANFRYDLNVGGFVNTSDILLAKGRSGPLP